MTNASPLSSFTLRPLKSLSLVRSSNVDKHTDNGECSIRLCNYVDVYKNERISSHLNFSVGSATNAEIAKFSLRAGDVLITKDSETPDDIAVSALVDASASGVVCGYHLAILRSDPRLLRGDFLFWCLKARPIKDAFSTNAQGITRFGLTLHGIGSVAIPCPDLNIQKTIARFLDHEIARVDRLIEKREAFLCLVAEKKAALSEHAINGEILRAPCDGEQGWFRRVPVHWSVLRAKFLFRERRDRSESGIEELLTVSHITGVTRRSDKDVNMFLAESMEGYKIVRTGDVVINTMWAWMGAMGVSPYNGLISPSYGVYFPTTDAFEAEYIDLLLRSKPFIAEATRRSKGIHSSRLRLYPDAFLDILLPVPSKVAQHAILTALRTATEKEERMAILSRLSLDRLSEFRSSLITAAVTGQLDIVAWQKRGSTDRRNDAIEAEVSQ